MIEMRQDPTTRTWILVGRTGGDPGGKESPDGCPFCPGHEAETPPAVAVIPGPDGAWRVRAFPDKMPVFQVEGDLGREGEGMYDRMRNVGAHEVVVETPLHATSLASLPAEDIARALQMFRLRIQDLKKDVRFRYIQVFKNQGMLAGSFIEHVHSHLVATPVIPRRLESELRWCKQHYDLKERCLYCDIVRQEVEAGTRLVERSPEFVAFCPFAPRFAYEVWVFPVTHGHRFEGLDDPALAGLARVLRAVLRRVERKTSDYHLVLHTAPNEKSPPVWGLAWETLPFDFHWHIEVLPRQAEVTRLHREEEFYVNPIPPEEAARQLRDTPTD
ncbi:MAG TPA: HIT domain-containing protein [Candidatus Methylomirabilis sp.]|nr:HIT domain-containing protein [Candidatus Methylomirabilis sp.]